MTGTAEELLALVEEMQQLVRSAREAGVQPGDPDSSFYAQARTQEQRIGEFFKEFEPTQLLVLMTGILAHLEANEDTKDFAKFFIQALGMKRKPPKLGLIIVDVGDNDPPMTSHN